MLGSCFAEDECHHRVLLGESAVDISGCPDQVFRGAQACPPSSKRLQSISLGGCKAQDTHLSHLASASLAVLGMPEWHFEANQHPSYAIFKYHLLSDPERKAIVGFGWLGSKLNVDCIFIVLLPISTPKIKF